MDPLGHEGADELLTHLLGDDATLVPLKALLLERTDRNPLFLEETVRSLIETGALVGERGRHRPRHPVRDVRVAATAHAMLAARIDRLPPEDKRLLQESSVVGKLYRRCDRMDDARAELEIAVNMLRSMDMTFWLPEAREELANVR